MVLLLLLYPYSYFIIIFLTVIFILINFITIVIIFITNILSSHFFPVVLIITTIFIIIIITVITIITVIINVVRKHKSQTKNILVLRKGVRRGNRKEWKRGKTTTLPPFLSFLSLFIPSSFLFSHFPFPCYLHSLNFPSCYIECMCERERDR